MTYLFIIDTPAVYIYNIALKSMQYNIVLYIDQKRHAKNDIKKVDYLINFTSMKNKIHHQFQPPNTLGSDEWSDYLGNRAILCYTYVTPQGLSSRASEST